MISVSLSGLIVKINENSTLEGFLLEHKPTYKTFAVAVNSQFIPNSSYADTYLRENDSIDIIIPMQGG
jgi:thiamine biosynthesis protein ThiS